MLLGELRRIIREALESDQEVRDAYPGEDLGKFLGMDDQYYVYDQPDPYSGDRSLISYSKNPRSPGEWDVFNYAGTKFSLKKKVSTDDVRSSFTTAWDGFFYSEDYDEEQTPAKQQAVLKRHMTKAGWSFKGTVNDVGITNLKKDDAVTSSETNEFYQFVLGKGFVENPGGRGKVKLTPKSVGSDMHVWRHN